MNIALIILHADPARGGAERYTVDLAHALARRGEVVTLVSSGTSGDEVVTPASEQVPYRSIQVPARGMTRAGRYRAFLDSLDRHLATQRYDIVHAMLPVRQCDVYHPHAGVAAEAVRAGHRKHVGVLKQQIARVNNRLSPRRRMFARVERDLLTSRDAPIVLCLSELVKETVRTHYPLGEDRLATLFNAVDLRKFDPQARPDAGREVRQRLGIGDDKVIALIIAQDFERKGVREAIDAVAYVHDPRLVLVVVGKPDPARYESHAGNVGVRDRVIFAGATTDPYAFYRAADLFVLPTRHDPCSLVVLESLAMGVPVISTIFNGACEIMTSGTHGFVLSDPGDTRALADAMRRMLDERVRREMSDRCLGLRPKLSYEHHLDELLDIYDRARH